jgi:hypothetical protein
MAVHGDLSLRVEAVGGAKEGTIRLLDAHIRGQLDTSASHLTNTDGPALFADGLRVDGDLRLGGDGFSATGNDDEHGAVRLLGARIGGRLGIDVDAITDAAGRPATVDLDGLVYSGLPTHSTTTPTVDVDTRVRAWVSVLRYRTPRYTAQPYRQLAAAAQAAGHEREARHVLMAQRRDQLQRTSTLRHERAWGALTYVVLGYGYQPWRALLFLLGIAVLAVTLTLIGGPRGGLVHPPTEDTRSATPCTSLEHVATGLDLSVPILDAAPDGDCAPTDTAWGRTITIGGWVLQATAWALATLFVAGFTGAVRKT